MSDEDSRFKNLIQPIKDLASNWDIDIAESLTEYLDELDGLRVSLDGGVNSLNFAEAALLIQGSTAIYSKKVEYLHQLVLQSLEYIANKKSSVAVNAKSKAAVQTAFNDDSILFGNDPDLLLLDDDVEMGTNINLKMLSGQATRDRKSRNSSGRFSTSSGLDVSRISISLMHSVLHDDHGSSNLKLSSCVMDPSGALLIGGIQSSSAANSQSLLNQSNSLFHNTSKAQDRSVGFMVQDYQDADNNDVYDDHGGADDMYGGGDDDNGYWEESAGVSAGAVDAATAVGEKKTVLIPTVAVRGAGGGGGGGVVPFSRPSALFSRHQWLSEPSSSSGGGSAVVPSADQLLDPHQLVPGSKAIGRGKTHRLPAALTARKAGNVEQEEEAQLSISEFLPKEGTSTLSELQQKMRAITGTSVKGDGKLQQGLFNPHLLPLLKSIRKAARKEKLAQNRKGSSKTKGVVVDYAAYERLWSRDLDQFQQGLVPFGEQGQDAEVVDLAGRLQLAAGVPEHEVLGLAAPSASAVGGGGDVFDNDDNGYYYDNNDDNGYDAAVGGGESEGGVFSRAVEEESEEAELARRLERVLNEDLVHSSNSYQAICERHIKNFHSGAERYAKETQLSRRVSDWTKRLEPILRAQEDAPQFDIHEYSDRILVDIGVVNQQTAEESGNNNEKGPDAAGAREWITFDDIARGKDATEVCRMFLACLQLANLGNIEFEELLPTKNAGIAGDATKTKKAGGKKGGSGGGSDVTRKRSESRELVLGVESLFHLRLVKENRHKHLEHFNRGQQQQV